MIACVNCMNANLLIFFSALKSFLTDFFNVFSCVLVKSEDYIKRLAYYKSKKKKPNTDKVAMETKISLSDYKNNMISVYSVLMNFLLMF